MKDDEDDSTRDDEMACVGGGGASTRMSTWLMHWIAPLAGLGPVTRRRRDRSTTGITRSWHALRFPKRTVPLMYRRDASSSPSPYPLPVDVVVVHPRGGAGATW
jgi:hypothetical protein